MNKSTGRSSYTSKTIPQRTAYQKYIRTTEKQPTVDENFDFDSTLKQGQELSQSTVTRKRPIPTKIRLVEHFQQHWIEWAIGIFIFVSLFIYVDTGKNIAVLEAKLTNQKEITDKLESTSENYQNNQSQKNNSIDSSINTVEKENNSQDLMINELKLRLGFLEGKINGLIVPPNTQP